MKPLVVSLDALRVLEAGLSEKVDISARICKFESDQLETWVTSRTELNEPRLVILRNYATDGLVPHGFTDRGSDVAGRLRGFLERALNRDALTLPRNWHQFKADQFISFRVLPANDPTLSRWIALVPHDHTEEVQILGLDPGDNQRDLKALNRESYPRIDLDGPWKKAIEEAEETERSLALSRDKNEVILEPFGSTERRVWTFDEWLGKATIQQQDFIQAPTSHSIRLRGPAGSGKSVALLLKAVREARKAASESLDTKILVATHSWDLAATLSDSLSLLLEDSKAIDVYPLLAVCESLSPSQSLTDQGIQLLGQDSLTGKRTQYGQIHELLVDFVETDWITFQGRTSSGFRSRLDAVHEGKSESLTWDLLNEFGSVLGASSIFPSAGAKEKYLRLPRASWMMTLEEGDKAVVYALYEKFWDALNERNMMTTDQAFADFLSMFEGHGWQRRRRNSGYDLIFVDEFHLFNPLERQIFHYLSRDASRYPRVFMAVDPRQSAIEAVVGREHENASAMIRDIDASVFGEVEDVDLTTVHRYTPQILGLVQHLHHYFPAYEMDALWSVNTERVDSSRSGGSKPALIHCGSRAAETRDIIQAATRLYSAGRIAIAIVDDTRWHLYQDLVVSLQGIKSLHVSVVTGRDEISMIGYRKRGVVVASAEHLAGLQFDAVLVCGIPDFGDHSHKSHERQRLISSLYLAISRASDIVQVYVNDDDGGVPEVLLRAIDVQLLERQEGSQV